MLQQYDQYSILNFNDNQFNLKIFKVLTQECIGYVGSLNDKFLLEILFSTNLPNKMLMNMTGY